MLKELLDNELIQLSVKITDAEDQLTEVMASGCGANVICLGVIGKGASTCDIN